MGMNRWICILLLCGCGGGSATTQNADTVAVRPEPAGLTAQVIRTAQDTVPDLRATTECSSDAPRRGIVRVEWRADRRPALTELSQRRIDLTVFYQGFERGQYVSAPLQENATFQPTERVSLMETAPAALRQPVVERAPVPAQPGWVAVELTRLEPGMLYRIRVPTRTPTGWLASQTIEVTAPVCPSDEHRN
jgi:hypothetical protein